MLSVSMGVLLGRLSGGVAWAEEEMSDDFQLPDKDYSNYNSAAPGANQDQSELVKVRDG